MEVEVPSQLRVETHRVLETTEPWFVEPYIIMENQTLRAHNYI